MGGESNIYHRRLARWYSYRPYGKPCGSKIESTKRTVIMPKNVRVLAINVRVFYKRTCFLINVRVSL